MSEYLKWGIKQDSSVLNSAVELTDANARNRYLKEYLEIDSEDIKEKVEMRMKVFIKAITIMKEEYHGTILEMGCGQGVLSGCFSRMQKVDKVLALDYSKVCVEELIPIVFSRLGADENKITRILGSFNDMQLEDNSIDFIVSNGTLHHSEDLLRTAQECYRVLKPGGWCIHSDTIKSHANSVQAKEQLKTPLSREKLAFRYGSSYVEKVITSEMLSSHQLFLCDIEHYFTKANFDIYSFPMIIINNRAIRPILYMLYKLFGNIHFMNYHRLERVPIYPWFLHKRLHEISLANKNLLFLCRKPPLTVSKVSHKVEKKRILQKVLDYLFVTNRQMERKYRNDLRKLFDSINV
ncbi:MAG: class I SAM-dependent methyltransferase [Candidatus Scalindua sp.]|nr:class I SAM-dependent methyltransferase [Candidatus Scalindua sp.]